MSEDVVVIYMYSIIMLSKGGSIVAALYVCPLTCPAYNFKTKVAI